MFYSLSRFWKKINLHAFFRENGMTKAAE